MDSDHESVHPNPQLLDEIKSFIEKDDPSFLTPEILEEFSSLIIKECFDLDERKAKRGKETIFRVILQNEDLLEIIETQIKNYFIEELDEVREKVYFFDLLFDSSDFDNMMEREINLIIEECKEKLQPKIVEKRKKNQK